MQSQHRMAETPFHGDNTGSNPVGDAKLSQQLSSGFAFHSWVQKRHQSAPFCTLFNAEKLLRITGPTDRQLSASFCDLRREDERQNCCLSFMLGRRHCLRVDAECRAQGGMPH